MITALLVIIGVTMVLGSGAMLLGLADSPEGYEDGDGFYLGPQPELGQRALLASTVIECRDDAGDATIAEAQAQRHGSRIAWPSVGVR